MPLTAPTPDSARLVSGDAVALDVRVARLGSRALSLLIDIILQLVLFTVLISIGMGAFGFWLGADDALLRALFIAMLASVFIVLPALVETISGGRSLGKVAMGLRVIRDDGGPVRFRHALTRALIATAVEWPGLVLPPMTWVVSLWTMLANPHGKRLGDLAAGTIVIHDRSPAVWGWVPAMPPALRSWAATLDLTGLPDELALSVRHYLSRNRSITEPARSRLGHALAGDVASCTTPPAPHGIDGWEYLAAVLAERNRRSALRLAHARAVTARVFPELTTTVAPTNA